MLSRVFFSEYLLEFYNNNVKNVYFYIWSTKAEEDVNIDSDDETDFTKMDIVSIY